VYGEWCCVVCWLVARAVSSFLTPEFVYSHRLHCNTGVVSAAVEVSSVVRVYDYCDVVSTRDRLVVQDWNNGF